MPVMIPASQQNDVEDNGTPLTVGQAVLSFMVPVKYYDNLGKPHQEFVFVVGDTVYKDKSGENWASGLKVMSDKVATEIVDRTKTCFAEAVKEALVSLGISIGSKPGHDEVDVLAGDTDGDVISSAK